MILVMMIQIIGYLDNINDDSSSNDCNDDACNRPGSNSECRQNPVLIDTFAQDGFEFLVIGKKMSGIYLCSGNL